MKKLNFETIAIRTQCKRTFQREHSAPLYLTSSYIFDDVDMMKDAFLGENNANIYSRFNNPNSDEFIQKMCLLEGSEAGFATTTGMASIFNTFLALLQQKDHIISCSSVFGSTHIIYTQILPKFAISHSYVNVNDNIDNWQKALRKETKILYLETPTNPAVDIVDLEKAAEFAKKNNLIFIVDNCFATPYLQNPIKYGADIVIHSATKYIDGQGRVLGGVVLSTNKIMEQIINFMRHSGPAISPFNAWILSKGLETLAIRMERHCDNALELANFLEKYSKVKNVRYPFLSSHPSFEIAKKQMKKGGGIVTFEVDTLEKGKKFLNNIQMCSLTANLGDTRSIVSHPASTTHSKLTQKERLSVGITDGMIRISVGLEHINDIKNDIIDALNKI